MILLALAAAAVPVDGSHGFDPEIGHWHTELRRLAQPLSGRPAEWVSYSGTTNVTPLWGGKGNLAELEVDGSAGHIEGLSVRLYDSGSGQWRMYYSNSTYGTLIGESMCRPTRCGATSTRSSCAAARRPGGARSVHHPTRKRGQDPLRAILFWRRRPNLGAQLDRDRHAAALAPDHRFRLYDAVELLLID